MGLLVLGFALPAAAQSFKVQCPNSTTLHPLVNGAPNPGIKCQQVAGTDGFATMGDGIPTYLFGFGPLSGIDLIRQGRPGTLTAAEFNAPYNSQYLPGVDAATNAPVADSQYDAGQPQNLRGAVMNPADMMNIGVLSAQQPAPLMAIDEDDELFLTLTNVGMIMRPDLFEQHTIHFHGYPNAGPIFDGVPDTSIAVNISGSMTYYYTAPDAGTYFWHCHITPPEHLQMGMVGQLYVRPRQNRLSNGADLGAALRTANLRAPGATDGLSCSDILCTGQTPVPAGASGNGTTGVTKAANAMYAYNDGDGSTRYDVEYPIQIMGFDPNFHFVGMTFNPEDFSGMKDKYFMLNGRSYPDTVNPAEITTQSTDGLARPSQTMPTAVVINKSAGQTRALLRISNLNITEMSTLATVGVPMQVIAVHARLLRDLAGNNLYYNSNSITIGGGETTDVILDVSDAAYTPGQTYFLYSANLDHLSNDAENFGGMMTEIVIQ
jgi:FtsP/CotA-like multicopper oxidase with cupredoxin domain